MVYNKPIIKKTFVEQIGSFLTNVSSALTLFIICGYFDNKNMQINSPFENPYQQKILGGTGYSHLGTKPHINHFDHFIYQNHLEPKMKVFELRTIYEDEL